jgi:hypothetical protein
MIFVINNICHSKVVVVGYYSYRNSTLIKYFEYFLQVIVTLLAAPTMEYYNVVSLATIYLSHVSFHPKDSLVDFMVHFVLYLIMMVLCIMNMPYYLIGSYC